MTETKKYVMSDETIVVETCNGDEVISHTLHRIIAIRNFGEISKGTVGGYVESEENLSHDGDCWIYDSAMVLEKGKVVENAKVRDNSVVYGNAIIRGSSKLSYWARVFGNAIISDESVVMINGIVCDTSIIEGNTIITDDATVLGVSKVKGCTVEGAALIKDSCIFDVIVSNNAKIINCDRISCDSIVTKTPQLIIKAS